MENKTITENREAIRFTAAQLLASQKYKTKKDLVGALLAEDKAYTTDEVDSLIETYLKGQVH